MSLGILNNISAIYAENNLNNTQSSLQKVLQQLSSGARINSGAADAAGLAIADGLKANESALTQSVRNASDGVGLLQTADGALAQVTNLLDRAVSLATEVANGTLSSNQVSSANREYQSILTEIGDIGSTTVFNGDPVFGGQSTSFYVGDGTSTGSNSYTDNVGALNATSVGQAAPASQTVPVLTPFVVDSHNTTSPTIVATNGVAGVTNASATYTYATAGTLVSGLLTFTDGATGGVQGATIAQNSTIAGAVQQLNANSAFAAVYHAAYANNVITVTSLTKLTGTAAGVATATAQTASEPGIQTYNLSNANDTLAGPIAFQQGALNVSTNFAPGTTLQQAVAQINAVGSPFQAAGVTAAAYVQGANQPNPLNLLINGGFENGLAGWGVDVASYVSTNAHSGSQSVELTGGQSSGGIYQTVVIAPGASYTVGGWLKVPGQIYSAYINIHLYDAFGNSLSDMNTVSVLSSSDWTYVSSTFSAPSSAVYMTIQPFAQSSTGPVYVDDVSVVPTAAEAGAATLVLTNTNSGANLNSYSTSTGTTLTENQPIQQLATPTIVASTASAGSTATFAALQNPATDDVVGTLRVAVGATGSPVSVQFVQGTTLAAAVLQLNNNAQLKAAGVVASASGGQLKLTGPQGTVANPTGSTLVTTGTLLFDTPPVAAAGAGTDFTSSALATLSSGSAQNVLTGVNAAIANVAYQRGILGADSNELTAASNTASSEDVNLTAAESSIRSTNYGQATSDLAKYEVLSQTGISALAQANTVQLEILKLLG